MAYKMKDTKHMSDMVCPFEAGTTSTSCTVHDTTPCSTQKKISFVVRPSNTVNEVFSSVATQFPYESFELVLQSSNQDQAIFLNDKKEKVLDQIPGFIPGAKNTLVLLPPGSWESNPNKKIDLHTAFSPTTPDPDPMSDDDLALGASASPTEPNSAINIPIPPDLPMFDQKESQGTFNKLRFYSSPRPALGYVGLVNQAMTCYLNSLLQALFMTPEFRNALYKRKFENDVKCIPYHLQRLFLSLQTSPKGAVETTDLTKSFGWDSAAAWQQHDIQELCRVMFDALECKFKGTDQENLINNLYEGKMIDYVKCLECCTEKSREDTYLDIPLPVRPFGSNVAYGSIEEALRAFVQPETLDGNNQYFCEKCDKKCDAHKGLKFKTFPYILTLHLKRFDFDYQTFHRIKLNDKVTYPQTLNLNSFVNATDSGTFVNLQNNNHSQINGFASSASSEHENTESAIKYDDCSTTDSGAALEEDNCSGIATTASSSHHENELQEDDEGIDMSTIADNRSHLTESGPYLYELFAIMIHSGSASGGHYYAYIKEFENGEWYCFNDQTVTTITQEDIQKSFGGGSFKAYYSGVYSSSTNAYMLMYRQIDPNKNEQPMRDNEFPEHVNKLVQELRDKEQEDKKMKPSESGILKPKVYFYNPKLKQLKDTKVYIARTFSLENALETAHGLLDVQNFAPVSRCRLVAYDHQDEQIDRSLEGKEKDPIGEVLNTLDPDTDFLLEVRSENEEFEKYEPGGVTVKIFKVDLNTSDVEGPYLVRLQEVEAAVNVKKLVGKKLGIKQKNLVVINYSPPSNVVILKEGQQKMYFRSKLFAASTTNSTDEITENLRKTVQENLTYLTHLFISVPSTDRSSLELLGIPKYEPKSDSGDSNFQTPKQSPSESKQDENSDVVDAVIINGYSSNSDQGGSGDFRRSSPLPMLSVSTGHESNSEDSSLSDGDRTLVESAPHDSSHVSSTSHSPQLSSPEEENGEKLVCRPILSHEINSDDDEDMELDSGLYFRAYNISENNHKNRLVNGQSDLDENKEKIDKQTMLKVFVDDRMKLGSFKRALEPYIGVPAEYFRLVRKQTEQLKLECTNLSESLSTYKDGEQVKVELGRNLKKGECKAKVHYLKLSELNNETGKLPVICEWIFKIGIQVVKAKRELIAQLHKVDPKYQTISLKNCRLWEKSERNSVRILDDDHHLGSDRRLSVNCELVVQECDEGVNTNTNEESLTLFVRRWHPSSLELGPFHEITLEKNSDIKKVLSSRSDIPEDKIAFCSVNSRYPFPCTNISVLDINNSLSWFPNSATSENFPLCSSQNGAVYFYRDNTEQLKDLTTEERRELYQKEKARLERIGGTLTSAYSPRKERALKIYLEK